MEEKKQEDEAGAVPSAKGHLSWMSQAGLVTQTCLLTAHQLEINTRWEIQMKQQEQQGRGLEAGTPVAKPLQGGGTCA